eukprot:g1513.t1
MVLSEAALDTPIRLTAEERRLLRLLRGALTTSDYTDKVDNVVVGGKVRRMMHQLQDVLQLLCGLLVASDFHRGNAMLSQSDLARHADWFARVFEVGRRFKVMNPARLRDVYGKLVYLLMDAELLFRDGQLSFSLWRPLRTVRVLLDEQGGGECGCGAALRDTLWRDSRLEVAVRPLPLPPAATSCDSEPGTALAARHRWGEELAAARAEREAARAGLRAAFASGPDPDSEEQGQETVRGANKTAAGGAGKTATDGARIAAPVLELAFESLSDGAAHVQMTERPVTRLLNMLQEFDDSKAAGAAAKPASGGWAAAATLPALGIGGSWDGPSVLLGAAAACALALALAAEGGRAWLWWAAALAAAVAYQLRYWQLQREPAGGSSGSLAIWRGRGGSCLSHTHAQQLEFVRQTLLLWQAVARWLPRLWVAAEQDLICGFVGKGAGGARPYTLRQTGQGVQRVQPAVRVARLMRRILERVRAKTGAWVGLSVVHLGDDDVPNALFFLDKYCQLPRILHPVVACVDALPAMFGVGGGQHGDGGGGGEDGDGVAAARSGAQAAATTQHYVAATFGSAARARRELLGDWFRHAFDGSGDSGGSCIDGRLTSAWNWCNQLEKKRYHPLFLLSGFKGFDGDFLDDDEGL